MLVCTFGYQFINPKSFLMPIPITHVLSHWGQAFPFCSMSANEFYSSVESIAESHEFSDVKVEHVKNKEGGLLSASREYLQIRHKELVFEVSATQFGKNFYLTSWLYETEGTLRQLLKFAKAGEYLSERAAKRTFSKPIRKPCS